MTPPRWRLVRDFAWVGSGTAVLAPPPWSRSWSLSTRCRTEQFAAYAFGWALYQIVSQLLSGFDLAYVDLTARAERAHDLDAVYLRMKMLGTVRARLGGAAVCGLIAHLDLGGHYSPAAIAGLAAGCVFGLFQTAMSRLQAHQRFRDFGRMVAIYNVVALAVTVALVGFGVTSAAVLLSAYTVSGIPWVWRLRHFAHTDRTRATRIAFVRSQPLAGALEPGVRARASSGAVPGNRLPHGRGLRDLRRAGPDVRHRGVHHGDHGCGAASQRSAALVERGPQGICSPRSRVSRWDSPSWEASSPSSAPHSQTRCWARTTMRPDWCRCSASRPW